MVLSGNMRLPKNATGKMYFSVSVFSVLATRQSAALSAVTQHAMFRNEQKTGYSVSTPGSCGSLCLPFYIDIQA